MKKVALKIYKIINNMLDGYGLGRFYPIKIIHNFLLKHLRSNFVITQGHKMFLDSEDSLRLSTGVYDEFEIELVKKEIKPGDTVLDLGANIGYYTLIFAKLVGKSGKVYAFEPDPNNFALLKKNVKINGYNNVVLINKAVSNKTEKLKLYLCEDNNGDHRIYDSHDGRKCIEIESVKLDNYFKDYNGKVDFIKIDIQGAEAAAAQGMFNLLKKNKSVKIISEFWPIGLKRFGVEPIEYLNLLTKLGFRLFNIEEQKKITPTSISELLERYTLKKENFANLLCVR
jgi:FkbM family methyltransferase